MNVLRFYDDRTLFLFNLFIQGSHNTIIADIIPQFYDRIEYCIVDSNTKSYKMYYFTKDDKKGIKNKKYKEKEGDTSWDLMKNNKYYVFLDTLWDEECLPKDINDRHEYGNRVYPGKLKTNLEDDRVQSLTVYTTFNYEAMNKQDEAMRVEYKKNVEEKKYFPKIMTCRKIVFSDKNNAKKYFVEPIQS